MVFLFKRDGYLETIGPAGTNALNTLYVASFVYSSLSDVPV